ncbi:endo-1,4-beta-xylanase [Chitinophagaceae bacterium 26-R-25]|nr:endo-1,4-beta-xylanase [Chitinophagaceae bacterium 26-R-25]
MKNRIILSLMLGAGIAGIQSCKKNAPEVNILNPGNYKDTAGTLKSVTNIPVGFGVYMGDKGFSQYFPIAAREGTNITPGNEMKHGSVVQNDGSLNFTNADALYNMSNAAGLAVYGHTLMWHQQQNSAYLSTIAGASAPLPPSVLANGDFETTYTSGSAQACSNWNIYNPGGSPWGGPVYYSTSVASETHGGTKALKIVNPSDNVNGQWKTQLASDLFNTTVGVDYAVTFWIKSATNGGSGRLSTGPTAQYQGDFTTSTTWTQIVWFINAKDAQTRILFDMGAKANTYFIDDARVMDKAAYDAAIASSSGTATAARVDSVMKLWILGNGTKDGIVKHYAGKVYAWDVANEVITDNGSLRVSSNTSLPSGAKGYFFWADYLGRSGIVNAFKYAKQADGNAKLFINDYNLEASKAKTDSLVALVKYVQANGGTVDGIGTQMHVNALTMSQAGIDYAFQQLAATGLLVRISELDVTIKPSPGDSSRADAEMLGYQAAMYKYIIDSYIKNVPATQRYGVTIWGVDDPDSWRATQLPLMWDKNFAKKPAYAAAMEALKASPKK